MIIRNDTNTSPYNPKLRLNSKRMTRPDPTYKKVDKWVYSEVKEIEIA